MNHHARQRERQSSSDERDHAGRSHRMDSPEPAQLINSQYRQGGRNRQLSGTCRPEQPSPSTPHWLLSLSPWPNLLLIDRSCASSRTTDRRRTCCATRPSDQNE
jgi:hypothetical protein